MQKKKQAICISVKVKVTLFHRMHGYHFGLCKPTMANEVHFPEQEAVAVGHIGSKFTIRRSPCAIGRS